MDSGQAGSGLNPTSLMGGTQSVVKSIQTLNSRTGDPERGYNYGGYNYLGPGNRLDGKPDKNELDGIAHEHDIAFANAKSVADIKRADEVFIAKASKLGSHGKLAALMIKTKTMVEGALGPIYPGNWRSSNVLRKN